MELLAPAGDFEKLVFACEYGANAVYLGGNALGLRAKAKNFGNDEIAKAIKYAHERDVKVYITANVFAHNEDFAGMAQYFEFLAEAGADAVIVSDLGVFNIASKAGLPIHISTQANVTNPQSALMWRQLGAERVVLARELSLEEITVISNETKHSGLELEVFVHGAMCMAYSGRCLISNFLTARDANRGQCSHSCRWNYSVAEQTRPGEYMPITENERGTFIFNSKDLRMIEHLDKIADAGVCSLKIEGRMKTPYYVASTLKAYRQALDDMGTSIDLYNAKMNDYLRETEKSSHREYCTGFFFGNPGADSNIYTNSSYIQNYTFAGVVLDYNPATKTATIEQRNKFSVGETVEFLQKNGAGFEQVVTAIYNDAGELVGSANHAQQIVTLQTEYPVEKYDIMRKRI